MANQGFWADADGLEGTADRLNAGMLQYDIAANRPAAGQTGRLFWDTTNNRLERDNGATWDIIFSSDPAAATAGLRTIGTSAVQASAGNHVHTQTDVTNDSTLPTPTTIGFNTSMLFDMGTSYGNAISVAHTPGSATRSVVIFGSLTIGDRSDTGVDAEFSVELRVDGAQVAVYTGTVPDWDAITISLKTYLISVVQFNLSAAAHTYELRSKCNTGGSEVIGIFGQSIGFRELSLQ